MFNTIITPVGLARKGDPKKTLDCTADLAGPYGTALVSVGGPVAAHAIRAAMVVKG